MHRQLLRLTFVLGVLVTILGGTGVFASFTDSSRGGPNSVTSGSRPSAADLQIASASLSTNPVNAVQCGTYSDNTSTTQFSATNVQPSSQALVAYVCLKNAGSALLNLTVGAPDVRDLDTSCTGDENADGDASCGNNGAGELSPLLVAASTQVDCTNVGDTMGGGSASLSSLGGTPIAASSFPLASNGVACIQLMITYDPAATEAQIQIAQSDQVTWSFTFTGTAS
jgi:predicted ribosomally synthesized peptide with SipW-like signal peptide